MKTRADALLVPRAYAGDVEIDPLVKSGMPIVKGTAMETSLVRKLRETMSEAEIAHSFPVLKPHRIKGALAWEHYLDQSMGA